MSALLAAMLCAGTMPAQAQQALAAEEQRQTQLSRRAGGTSITPLLLIAMGDITDKSTSFEPLPPNGTKISIADVDKYGIGLRMFGDGHTTKKLKLQVYNRKTGDELASAEVPAICLTTSKDRPPHPAGAKVAVGQAPANFFKGAQVTEQFFESGKLDWTTLEPADLMQMLLWSLNDPSFNAAEWVYNKYAKAAEKTQMTETQRNDQAKVWKEQADRVAQTIKEMLSAVGEVVQGKGAPTAHTAPVATTGTTPKTDTKSTNVQTGTGQRTVRTSPTRTGPPPDIKQVVAKAGGLGSFASPGSADKWLVPRGVTLGTAGGMQPATPAQKTGGSAAKGGPGTVPRTQTTGGLTPSKLPTVTGASGQAKQAPVNSSVSTFTTTGGPSTTTTRATTGGTPQLPPPGDQSLAFFAQALTGITTDAPMRGDLTPAGGSLMQTMGIDISSGQPTSNPATPGHFQFSTQENMTINTAMTGTRIAAPRGSSFYFSETKDTVVVYNLNGSDLAVMVGDKPILVHPGGTVAISTQPIGNSFFTGDTYQNVNTTTIAPGVQVVSGGFSIPPAALMQPIVQQMSDGGTPAQRARAQRISANWNQVSAQLASAQPSTGPKVEIGKTLQPRTVTATPATTPAAPSKPVNKDAMRAAAVSIREASNLDAFGSNKWLSGVTGINLSVRLGDGTAIANILQDKTEAEIAEIKAQYKAMYGTEMINDLIKSGLNDVEFAKIQELLNKKDGQSNLAGHIHTLIVANDWKSIRDILRTLNAAQIAQLQQEFSKSWGYDGSLRDQILKDPDISDTDKQFITVYLKGTDNLTTQDILTLADIALKAGNMDLFREVFQRAPQAARDQFFANGGADKILDAFGSSGEDGEMFPNNETRRATEYAQTGKLGLETQVRDNTGTFSNSDKAIEQAIAQMTPEERKSFIHGKELAANPGTTLTAADKKDLDYYNSVHKAFVAAVNYNVDLRVARWEEMIIHPEGSIVIKLVPQIGLIFNSGQGTVQEVIQSMTKAEWELLKNDPNNYALAVKTLESFLSGASLSLAKGLLDRIRAAATWEEAQQIRRDVRFAIQDTGIFVSDKVKIVNLILNMTADERERYKNNTGGFRDELDKLVVDLLSGTKAYTEVRYILDQYKAGKLPEGILATILHDITTGASQAQIVQHLIEAQKKDPQFKFHLGSDAAWLLEVSLRTGPFTFVQYMTYVNPLLAGDSLSQEAMTALFGDAAVNLTSQGGLKPEDRARLLVLGKGGVTRDEIKQMLDGMTPAQIEEMKNAYAQKYNADLTFGVLGKYSGKEWIHIRRALRRPPATMQEALQYLQEDYNFSVTPLGKAMVNMWDGTGYMLDDGMGKVIVFLANNSTAAEQMDPKAFQAAVDAAVKDLNLFVEAKSGVADRAADAAILVIAIGGSVVSGGTSLVLVVKVTAAGAVAKIVTKSAIEGNDYEWTVSNVTFDAMTGGIDAAVGLIGPGAIGKIFGVGEKASLAAAEKVVQALAEKGGILGAGSNQALKTGLLELISNAIVHGAKEVDQKAILALAEKLVAKELTGAARQEAVQAVATAIKSQVTAQLEGAAFANALTEIALNAGAGAAGGTISGTTRGVFQWDPKKTLAENMNMLVQSGLISGLAGGAAGAGITIAVKAGGAVVRGLAGEEPHPTTGAAPDGTGSPHTGETPGVRTGEAHPTQPAAEGKMPVMSAAEDAALVQKFGEFLSPLIGADKAQTFINRLKALVDTWTTDVNQLFQNVKNAKANVEANPASQAARDQYAAALKALNNVVKEREAQLQALLDQFTRENNLPSVRLKVKEDIPGAYGWYALGQGLIAVKRIDLFGGRDIGKFLMTLYHELTHSEQENLMVRKILQDLNIGATVSDADRQAIRTAFKDATNAPLSESRLDDILAARPKDANGQPVKLTDAEVGRANTLLADAKLRSKIDSTFQMTQPFIDNIDAASQQLMTDPNGAINLLNKLKDEQAVFDLFGDNVPPKLAELQEHVGFYDPPTIKLELQQMLDDSRKGWVQQQADAVTNYRNIAQELEARKAEQAAQNQVQAAGVNGVPGTSPRNYSPGAVRDAERFNQPGAAKTGTLPSSQTATPPTGLGLTISLDTRLWRPQRAFNLLTVGERDAAIGGLKFVPAMAKEETVTAFTNNALDTLSTPTWKADLTLDWSKFKDSGMMSNALKTDLPERVASIQQLMDNFADSQGLPRVEVVVGTMKDTARAGYTDGKLLINRKVVLNLTDQTKGDFIASLFHEFLHNEQDFLILRNLADEAGVGGSKVATPQQIESIKSLYNERTGRTIDDDRVAAAVTQRDGVQLNGAEKARANTLADAFLHNAPLPPEMIVLRNTGLAIEQGLKVSPQEIINAYANGTQEALKTKLLAPLKPEERPVGSLTQILFGTNELPANVQSLVDGVKNGTVKANSPEVGNTVQTGLKTHLTDVNNQRKDLYGQYMQTHEQEAFVVGGLVQVAADNRINGVTGAQTGQAPKTTPRLASAEPAPGNTATSTGTATTPTTGTTGTTGGSRSTVPGTPFVPATGASGVVGGTRTGTTGQTGTTTRTGGVTTATPQSQVVTQPGVVKPGGVGGPGGTANVVGGGAAAPLVVGQVRDANVGAVPGMAVAVAPGGQAAAAGNQPVPVKLGEFRHQVEVIFQNTGTTFITPEMIDAKLATPNLPIEQIQVLTALKQHWSDIADFHDDEAGPENDGVTREDIRLMIVYYNDAEKNGKDRPLTGDEKDGMTVGNNVKNTMIATFRTINSTPMSLNLYGNAEHPEQSIIPGAVKQGSLGDCYFLSAVASVAATPGGPQLIMNMIKDNGNGTYTVTFPGADADEPPIIVNAPTVSDLITYARGTEYGTWPAVLESAYNQWASRSFTRRTVGDLFNTDPKTAAGGGSVSNAGIRIMTGGGVDSTLLFGEDLDDIANDFNSAFQEGRIATVYVNDIGTKFLSILGITDNKVSDLNLANMHEYSVIGFNYNTANPEQSTIVIRNPYGFNVGMDPKEGGVLTLNMAQFKDAFSGYALAEKPLSTFNPGLLNVIVPPPAPATGSAGGGSGGGSASAAGSSGSSGSGSASAAGAGGGGKDQAMGVAETSEIPVTMGQSSFVLVIPAGTSLNPQ